MATVQAKVYFFFSVFATPNQKLYAKPSKDDSETLEQLAEESLEFQSGVRDLEDTISEVRVRSIRHASPNKGSSPLKKFSDEREGIFRFDTALTRSQSMKTRTTFTNSYCTHKLWLSFVAVAFLNYCLLSRPLSITCLSRHINFTCSSAEIYSLAIDR